MMNDLRATLDAHGSNLVVHPAHSLQGGEVIAQLELMTHHVLLLVDDHAGLLMVLYREETKRLARTGRFSSGECENGSECVVFESYSAADGPEGDHPLNAVGVGATVGLKARVVSLLQHKLLATEAGVLIAHPATNTTRTKVGQINIRHPSESKFTCRKMCSLSC